jgi:hypothetical protein
MTEHLQGKGHMSPPAKPNDNPLTDPTNAPLGTIVVFPRWQDGHHPTDIAIRWAPPYDIDEQYPWLILGSEGPQQLGNDSVEGCEMLAVPAVVACAWAATPRRWMTGLGAV